MFLSLAWRNLWRNPRRTAIILSAIIVGVWTMILLGAVMRGMVVQMVENGISTLTGHLQIHRRGYHDDPSVESSILQVKAPLAQVRKLLPGDAHWTTRVRVNAVASNARHSTGVTLVGIDPERERQASFIGKAVFQGHYLKPGDHIGIIVGKALLEKYQTRLGRKLILMSRDTHKEIASRAFRIVGVYQAEMEATEKQFVFITKSAAQKMLKLGGGVSEITVILPDEDALPELKAKLQKALGPKFEVLTWRELLPILDAYVSIFDDFMGIWYLVVFVAMGFGIANTVLMAVYERVREFGLMEALGMKPRWIVGEVLLESLFILVLGLAAGNLLGFISAALLNLQGIDLTALAEGSEFFGMPRILYPVLFARDIVLANAVVLILGLLVSTYPAWKASRFIPVEALRHI